MASSARTTVTLDPVASARRTASPSLFSNSTRFSRPVSLSCEASSASRSSRRCPAETSRTVTRRCERPASSETARPDAITRMRPPSRCRNVSSPSTSPRVSRSECHASISCRCSGGQNGYGATAPRSSSSSNPTSSQSGRLTDRMPPSWTTNSPSGIAASSVRAASHSPYRRSAATRHLARSQSANAVARPRVSAAAVAIRTPRSDGAASRRERTARTTPETEIASRRA